MLFRSVQHGVIEKSGAWYSCDGERIGQGRDNVRDFLKQNEDVAQAVETALRDRLLSARGDSSAGEPEGAVEA